MKRMGIAIALGFLLGWGGAHMLHLGSWTLLPWGLVAGVLGYWAGRRLAGVSGGLYGFMLAFTFMLAGYRGHDPIVTRVPIFAVLGLFGALCGLVLAVIGSLFRPRPQQE